MVEDKDPFGYPLATYLWVIGLSVAAGIVKYINTPGKFAWRSALRDVITAAFTGLVAFWVCENFSITGPMEAVCVAVTAVMGNRAWVEFENLVRMRLGQPPASTVPQTSPPSPPAGDSATPGDPKELTQVQGERP